MLLLTRSPSEDLHKLHKAAFHTGRTFDICRAGTLSQFELFGLFSMVLQRALVGNMGLCIRFFIVTFLQHSFGRESWISRAITWAGQVEGIIWRGVMDKEREKFYKA